MFFSLKALVKCCGAQRHAQAHHAETGKRAYKYRDVNQGVPFNIVTLNTDEELLMLS